MEFPDVPKELLTSPSSPPHPLNLVVTFLLVVRLGVVGHAHFIQSCLLYVQGRFSNNNRFMSTKSKA